MKNIPRVGFVCVGQNALELSGAICCAGRFMRLFCENGYMTGGSYSCINPAGQIISLKERIEHMCLCNNVVVAVGCDGFRPGDIIPDIIESLGAQPLGYFSYRLSSEEYVDAEKHTLHRCFPSRSVAVKVGDCLLLSVPADLHPSLGKLASLLPAISYAIGMSGKSAGKSLQLDGLLQDFYATRTFHE